MPLMNGRKAKKENHAPEEWEEGEHLDMCLFGAAGPMDKTTCVYEFVTTILLLSIQGVTLSQYAPGGWKKGHTILVLCCKAGPMGEAPFVYERAQAHLLSDI